MRYIPLGAVALALILISCTPAPKYRTASRVGAAEAESPVADTIAADTIPAAPETTDARDTPAGADTGAVTADTSGAALILTSITPPLRGFAMHRAMSPFGARGNGQHEGVDIDAETGEEVLAAAAGTIVFAGSRRGYGTLVTIDHGSGISTSYGHLSAATVQRGDFVLPGETIGRVGAGGNATGSHLHFEVRRAGVAIDPSPYLWLDSGDSARP